MELEIELKIVKVVKRVTVIVENELDARMQAAAIVKQLKAENPREEFWFETEEITQKEED